MKKLTKAEKCRQSTNKNWADPAFRKRMVEAQRGIGLRTYPLKTQDGENTQEA